MDTTTPTLHLESIRPWPLPTGSAAAGPANGPAPVVPDPISPPSPFGPSATPATPLDSFPPPNSEYSHLMHAGVLHELLVVRASAASPALPRPLPRVLWRSAGQFRADLAPSPPLSTVSACLSRLPQWTPNPVAIQLQSDRLIRYTDVITGEVRWTSLILTGPVDHVRMFALQDNGVAFVWLGGGGGDGEQHEGLVGVLVDHPSAEQSVVAVQGEEGEHGLKAYQLPRGHRVLLGGKGGAAGDVWVTAGNGKVQIHRVQRLPAPKVYPEMKVQEMEDEDTMMVDASFVSGASLVAVPGPARQSLSSMATRRGSELSKPGTAKTTTAGSRKSARRSSRRSATKNKPDTQEEETEGPEGKQADPSTSSKKSTSKPIQDPETEAKQHRQQQDSQRANATVLQAQPTRPPRLVPELDTTATRLVLSPIFSSPIHVLIARVIECETVLGHLCLAIAFRDGSVSVHQVDGEGQPMKQLARWERAMAVEGVRVWGMRAVAVMLNPHEMEVWVGYKRVMRVDLSRLTGPTCQLALSLGDRLVFKVDKGKYVQASLASVRWSKSPEMRAVLHVLGAVLPLDMYLAVRDTGQALDPLAKVILNVTGTHCPVLCIVAVALFLLVQEWSLNLLMHRSARHLAEALVPLLIELGWMQHLEYLAHRYFADRVVNVLGRYEARLKADAREPSPLCLVAFAHANEADPQHLVWPMLHDLRRQFGVLDDQPAAQLNTHDQHLFPMTLGLAHLIQCLHSCPTDPDLMLSHLAPALAHLHGLWQHSRAAFQSLPLGWRMLVICTIELARLEPELVGALPFSATTFLDRDDLAFGPPPPLAAFGSGSSNNSNANNNNNNNNSNSNNNDYDNDNDNDNNDHTLHDPQDLAMARQLLTLPKTLHVAYNYRYLQGAEHKQAAEQQAVLDQTVTRILAVYTGAGALDFKCAAFDKAFVPANPVPLPLTCELNFETRGSKDISAEPYPLEIPSAEGPPTNAFDWVMFHAGVAKALAMQLPAELMGPPPPGELSGDVTRNGGGEGVSRADPLVEWLWASRPALTSRPWPMPLGGWYLGLGLLGYLVNLPPEFLTYLLVPTRPLPGSPPIVQPGIDVGVLLGVACSRVGTSDSGLFRVLLLYAPDVFGVSGQPAAAPTTLGQRPQPHSKQQQLHSVQTQMAAVLATGLVMAGSGHGEVSGNLIENAIRVPHVMSPDKNGLGDMHAGEGMRIIGAVALAFVQLELADNRWLGLLAPLWDMRNLLATVTAAPAWIVLGWVYFNSKRDEVKKAAAIGHVGSSQVREMLPHVLFHRVVAGMLVEWDDISVEYVKQLRARVRIQAKEMAGTSASTLTQMAADTVVTAAVYALALKRAGTADRAAAQLCWELVDELVQRLHVDPDIVRNLDADHKFGIAPATVLQTSNQANQWIYTTHVSAALILSGTGDRTAYHRLVRLQHRTGPNISFGLHAQVNLALGLLFCGRGRHAVRSTTPLNALALFASTLPCFTPVAYDDHTTTLHAMTHLWVLAAKASVVQAISVKTGEPVTVHATLSRPDDDSQHKASTTITLPHKFELPLPAPGAWTLSIDDPSWYPLMLLVDDLIGGHGGARAVQLLPKNGLELASHPNASRVIQATMPGKVQHLLGQLMHLVASDTGSAQVLEAVRLLGARAIGLKLFPALDRMHNRQAGEGQVVSRITVEVERVRQKILSKLPLPAFSGPIAHHVEAVVSSEGGTPLHGLLSLARRDATAATNDMQEVASRAVFHGALMSTKLVQDHVKVAELAQELGVEPDPFLLMLAGGGESILK